MNTYAYGFPRLGRERQFKHLLEEFWAGNILETELRDGIDRLEEERLSAYRSSVDYFPVGEMTMYDPMLDMGIMLGLYPEGNDLDRYFQLARGVHALEMTKWFNTNYHYLVPVISVSKTGQLLLKKVWNKPLNAFLKCQDSNQGKIPFLIGPYTFARLSKGFPVGSLSKVVRALVPVYRELLDELRAAGAEYIHVDEPAFAGDVSEADQALIHEIYQDLGRHAPLLLIIAYDQVDFLSKLFCLPVAGFGLDFVHGVEALAALRTVRFPADKILVAGVVDGRSIWKTNLLRAAEMIDEIRRLTEGQIWVSNAAPLFHLPVSLEGETMEPYLRERICFAEERLNELALIKTLVTTGPTEETRRWNQYSQTPLHWNNEAVRQRVARLTPKDAERSAPYAERSKLQQERLKLPMFPTTTIGSFPQTGHVRKARTDVRSGKLSRQAYAGFMNDQIREVVRVQEEIGLDVFVHGEFERSDMVEYFAEHLGGFEITRNGWVISYGSRIYRPPLICGDVVRAGPITVENISFAQSLTKKPMKGMLTGPITILAWSFVREDLPLSDTACQLALAIHEEVLDLEKAGIRIIQIDEPAFRELAPMKRAMWPAYFAWAARAFCLAAKALPETQIHTHMCYSEFNEIIEYISALDADVITIEATRSRGEVIAAFERFRYPRQIGPGVYDIHTPAVVSPEEMAAVIERAIRVIPAEQIWVNPDCGLKTRGWNEAVQALHNMVAAARLLRERAKKR
ncbi:MAG: 5-methyltetrahydropteroyltriglutamate--homocysteine S-methyltransferase [Candidatus Riflebacteria bacterium]|nr:5-methyltetrahydropteroyltriglutamate--homocysteine S-methyltransferase [Candidatus Riflebacteria bacterium]